jgi:TP901 family phage tail tape measure protein
VPLGARDIMMVVRARDLASRTLRNIGNNMGVMSTKQGALANQMFNIGSAMTTVGLGMAAVGAAGVTWLDNSIDAAIEYNNEAAKTLTQMDGLKSSLEEVKDIARDVAREIPAPFEQMQESLYDIFSSMDVTVNQSKTLLREFSRAAVGGQVDLSDAARGTIGILNAYQMQAEDVHRVNDVMFQLVRKGVGTYGEFNSTIGLAVPAAVRAGQEIEILAGMMAFMTRNGISASRSASSAMRALENFADPRIVARLEKMGISVKDAAGEFLPLTDVVRDLGKKLEGLPGPEKSKILQDLLKGAGNSAQARRFWNLAIENYDEFQQRVDEMINSAGSLDEAYGIMFEDPQTQIQLLRNQYEVLRSEIGDELIPIKLELAQAALKIIDAWNSLDDGTKKLIIRIAAFASAFLLVSGIVITIVGGLTALVAVIMSFGVTFGAAIAILGGFFAALLLIPVAIFLIIKHWDTLKRWASTAWEAIKAGAQAAWEILQSVASWLVSTGQAAWQALQSAIDTVWQAMQKFWDWLSGVGVSVWHKMVSAWNSFIGAIRKGWKWFDDNFGEGFRKIFGTLIKEVPAVLQEVGESFSAFAGFARPFVELFVDILATGLEWLVSQFRVLVLTVQFVWSVLQPILMILASNFKLAFDIIVEVIQFGVTYIKAAIETFIGFIVAAWQNFGGVIISSVKSTWNFVSTLISSIIKVISNTIQLFLNIFQGDWSEAWDNIKAIFGAAWDAIFAALKFAFESIRTFFVQLPGKIVGFIGDVTRLLWGKGQDIIRGLWRGLQDIIDSVWTWFRGIVGRIKNAIPNPVRLLYEIGRAIVQGLIDGIKNLAGAAVDAIAGIGGGILDKGKSLLGISSPSKEFRKIGEFVDQGFIEGIKGMAPQVFRAVDDTFGSLTNRTFNVNGALSGSNGIGPVNPVSGAGLTVMGDLVVREERAVDDMDWFARTRLSGV